MKSVWPLSLISRSNLKGHLTWPCVRPGHIFFVLCHSHTWTVHCQSLGNRCECQGSSDRGGVFKFLLAHLSWKLNLSFSDHLLCVGCLSVCPSVCRLFRLSTSYPEPLGQFQPNLAQTILGWRGFKFVHRPFPRGDFSRSVKLYWKYLKNLLLQNHWANKYFIQTWHNAFLDEGDSS